MHTKTLSSVRQGHVGCFHHLPSPRKHLVCHLPQLRQLEHRCVLCGSSKIDPKAALSGLKSGPTSSAGSADPAYVNGAAFLRSIGLTNQADIARVLDVAMNPNSLYVNRNDVRHKNANARLLDVDKDMKPVVEFLLSKGVSVGDVNKVISAHPPLLSYDVETRLRPFWEYLESTGIQNVAETIVNRPSLMGLDADKNLKKIVEYLKYVETPPEAIAEYLQKSI